MRLPAMFAIAAILAGALCADSITYWKGTGAKRTAENVGSATITGWSAKSVAFKNAAGGSEQVETTAVIALSRSGGSMGKDLQAALELIAEDPATAAAQLEQVASKGSDLDKEEARFRLAEMYDAEIRQSSKADSFDVVIQQYQRYTGSHKAGYFARDAYVALSEFQLLAGKVADARATLKNMAGADPTLARMGNQKLGELETRMKQPDWKAALAAFKSAETNAGADQNGKYLAIACQGMAHFRLNNVDAARTMLEPIVADEAFQDDTSNDDERALAVAYPVLADAHFQAGNFQKAYDAYVQGAYYQWWNLDEEDEGRCVGQAYLCARKLQGTDDKWKKRTEKLKAALAAGFPKVLQQIEKE